MITGACNCCSLNNIRSAIICYAKAKICGVEFAAGHDIRGNQHGTCGSVVTCVVDGRSRYGLVSRFFSHSCDHNTGSFAIIEWLKKPDYPFMGTPLVVRIRDNSPPVCDSPRSIVSIFDIDPSRIIVDRSDEENSYYMCRIEGFDTVGDD